MTELEKLDAGLEYDFWDEGVNSRKLHAVEGCKKLNAIDSSDEAAVYQALNELLIVRSGRRKRHRPAGFHQTFHWTDTYVIDVRQSEDAIYALMFVLAIDAEKCSRN